MKPSKQAMTEGGTIAALLAGALALDPAVIAKLWDDMTPSKAAVLCAVLVFLYMRDNPVTKAKIKDLTARASVPPGAK